MRTSQSSRWTSATAVSVGIPWSKIETAEGRYDFRFLDWFIEQARKRSLKLVVNLFNSNVCGKVREADGSPFDPGYTPFLHARRAGGLPANGFARTVEI